MQQGRGAQRPQSVKGKGPKDPGVEAPLAAAGCRGNHLLNASFVAQLDRPVDRPVEDTGLLFMFDDASVVRARDTEYLS